MDAWQKQKKKIILNNKTSSKDRKDKSLYRKGDQCPTPSQ